MGNILVDRKPYYGKFGSMATNTKITDLGEAKRYDLPDDEMAAHNASYGARNARAPEIRGAFGWSTQAEIYSFGVICCDIIEARARYFKGEVPEMVGRHFMKGGEGVEGDIVPSRLKRILRECLRMEPDERALLSSVTEALTTLVLKFIEPSGEEDDPGVYWNAGDERTLGWELWDRRELYSGFVPDDEFDIEGLRRFLDQLEEKGFDTEEVTSLFKEYWEAVEPSGDVFDFYMYLGNTWDMAMVDKYERLIGRLQEAGVDSETLARGLRALWEKGVENLDEWDEGRREESDDGSDWDERVLDYEDAF